MARIASLNMSPADSLAASPSSEWPQPNRSVSSGLGFMVVGTPTALACGKM